MRSARHSRKNQPKEADSIHPTLCTVNAYPAACGLISLPNSSLVGTTTAGGLGGLGSGTALGGSRSAYALLSVLLTGELVADFALGSSCCARGSSLSCPPAALAAAALARDCSSESLSE